MLIGPEAAVPLINRKTMNMAVFVLKAQPIVKAK
jgi:hypothetical protein